MHSSGGHKPFIPPEKALGVVSSDPCADTKLRSIGYKNEKNNHLTSELCCLFFFLFLIDFQFPINEKDAKVMTDRERVVAFTAASVLEPLVQ